MTPKVTSITWRVNAERIVLLGWARAILLQLAHPLVAAGVFDHSGFRGTPYAAASRLYHTVHAMLSLTFGDEAARQRTIEGIRAIHRRVNGVLQETTGPYAAGTRYSAEDPALVLWVHTTLIESVLMVYEKLVRSADRGRSRRVLPRSVSNRARARRARRGSAEDVEGPALLPGSHVLVECNRRRDAGARTGSRGALTLRWMAGRSCDLDQSDDHCRPASLASA